MRTGSYDDDFDARFVGTIGIIGTIGTVDAVNCHSV